MPDPIRDHANDNNRPAPGDAYRATAARPGLHPGVAQALRDAANLLDAIARTYGTDRDR